jgi:integrase
MALKFTRLTRPAIRAMQPGDKISEHGIIAERQRNGDVRYSVNIMVDGQRVHRVIGRESEGVTREQAERAIERFRTEARDGRLDLPKGRKRHRTVAEASDEYLQRMAEGGGKNLRNKTRHLRQQIIPFMGKERLDRLTEFRLLQYRKARGEQGTKPATINRELATLSHLLRLAASKDWGWIKPDAVPKIPRAAEARKPIKILEPGQAEKLMQAAIDDQDPDAWLFVLCALNVPMRHEEITARRFDEVDWENCQFWINRAKAGERTQPITPGLRDALLSRRTSAADPDGWIFPSRSANAKVPHRRSMAKTFRRVVKRAGLDPSKLTPHILRHTGISLVLMNGTDLKTAQIISGHKTVAMLMHYAHVFAPHIQSAMSVLDRKIPDTITPKLHTEGQPEQPAADAVVRITAGKSAA